MGSSDFIVVGLVVAMLAFTVIIIYLLDRWTGKGPFYFKTDITSEQEKALDDARERLPRKYWLEDIQPFGKPMYKGKAIPRFKMVFYKECV